MICAVYPGTFDPVTLGHENVVYRSLALFGKLIVAVARNHRKKPFFSFEERLLIASTIFKDEANIQVIGFSGLLADFVLEHKGNVLIRGVRAANDFEYEFQMAGMNQYLMPNIETVFLVPTERHLFISSTLVREVAMMGGDVTKFVSPAVSSFLKEKLNSSSDI